MKHTELQNFAQTMSGVTSPFSGFALLPFTVPRKNYFGVTRADFI